MEMDSTEVDRPGLVEDHINPYATTAEVAAEKGANCDSGDARKKGATQAVLTDKTPEKTIQFHPRKPALQVDMDAGSLHLQKPDASANDEEPNRILDALQ